MSHQNILDVTRSGLIVIDVQESFRGAVVEFPTTAARISTMVAGAAILGVPILVTEQYPKGLGHTAEEVSLALPENAQIFEKTAFSSCGAAPFVAALKESGVDHAIVCGLETHICVNQTVHQLLAEAFSVHILADCVASRSESDRDVGLAKMYASGAIPSCVEMALFELMRDSKNEHFKEIQALIK